MADPINLPLESQKWAMHRVLVRKKPTDTAWITLPGTPRGPVASPVNGYHVLRYSRAALPQIGEAAFRFRFGVIDGVLYGTSGVIPDYQGYEVRIQAADGPTDEGEAADWDPSLNAYQATWQTVWWGWVEWQEDHFNPGDSILTGDRIYHCRDAMERTKRWPLRRHAAYGSNAWNNCEGHPGYNCADVDGRLMGNRETSGVIWDPQGDLTAGDTRPACRVFTFAGAGQQWTDQQVVEHALNTSRGRGDMKLAMAGSVALYGSKSAWRVGPDDSGGSVTERICRRQRGRGLVFIDWDPDIGGTDGAVQQLVPHLRVNPQTLDDISYTPPGAATVTLPGATTAATTVAVVIEGDHRNIAKNFVLGNRYEHRVDYLESVSTERIEVLATFGYIAGNLEKRWSDSMQTTFEGLDTAKRTDKVYEPVYQLHGLAKGWSCTADNGDGTSSRVDYRCSDAGLIITPSGPADTSPLTIRLLTTVPLYEGYTYDGATPVRKDGATETQAPCRRQPLLLLRKKVNLFWDAREHTDAGVDLCIHGIEFRVRCPADNGQDFADRTIGDKAKAGAPAKLNSQFNYQDLVLAGALELPHRMRMAAGDPNGGRRMRVQHRDLHLWLAHPGAIWDLDSGFHDSDFASPVRRQACPTSGGPGILRDDRATLAMLHALAVSWYMPVKDRRVARWSLRCCGFLDSFKNDPDGDGSTVAVKYPKLGQLVTTLGAGGQDWQVNTPITSVSYDNETGITTWSTDWCDLDLSEVAIA